MLHSIICRLSGPVLALGFLLLGAAPALASPPWISVEYPANPHERATRGALMVVHTYHHGTRLSLPVTARAEGLLDGRRQSVPLQLTSTSQPGSMAIRGELPDRGSWVVVLTLRTESGAEASALVALGPDGSVGAVHVPVRMAEGWHIPRAATAADVEQMLRLTDALARAQRDVRLSAGSRPDGGRPWAADLGVVLLLPFALALRRRR